MGFKKGSFLGGKLLGLFCTTATNFLSPDDTLVADAASPVQVSLVRWPKLVETLKRRREKASKQAMLCYPQKKLT